MTDLEKQTVTSAFELVRKHGFVDAQRLSDQWRDLSSPGTVSFALHNAVSKQIREFATVGALYRPIGGKVIK